MRGRGVAMPLDPRDLRLQQLDALTQFVEGIGTEILARQQVRGVALLPGPVVVVHCAAIVPPGRLAVNAAARYAGVRRRMGMGSE